MTLTHDINPRHRQLIMATILVSIFMVGLDMSIANVALPEIQGGLGIAPDQIGWVLTSYLIASAIATPLMGGLVPFFGVRRLYILSIACFGLASFACGMSNTVGELVLFRALQGVASAGLFPLGQSLVYDIYPRERIAKAISIFSMGGLAGAVVGPSLGGVITDVSSWRWIFLVNVPIATIAVIGMTMLLPKTARMTGGRFDFVGFGFLAVALCSLQLLLDRGEGKDWFDSTEIVIETVLAGTAFYLFVGYARLARHPFVDLAIFKDRNFASATILITVIQGVYFVPNAFIPLFLQHVQGYDVLTTGFVMTPRGFGLIFSTIVFSRIADRVDQRMAILVGILFLGAGFVILRFLTPDTPVWVIVWTGVIQSIGSSLMFVPLTVLAFSTLTPEMRPMGTSLFALCRNTSMSAGTAMALAYAADSTTSNHVRMMDNISLFNPMMTGPALPDAWSLTDPTALKLLSLEVWRQATTIAYNNTFTLCAIFLGLLLPLVFIVKRAPKVMSDGLDDSVQMAHG